MNINPTDWVLYVINPTGYKHFLNGRVEVKFQQFRDVPNYLKNRLNYIFTKYYHYTTVINYSTKEGNLALLLVCDERAGEYMEKLNMPFKASNEPFKGMSTFFDTKYYRRPINSIMGLYGALNTPTYGFGTKKAIGSTILQFLSDAAYTDMEYFRKMKEKHDQIWINLKTKYPNMETQEKQITQKRFVEISFKDKDGQNNKSGYILIHNIPVIKEITNDTCMNIVLCNYTDVNDEREIIHNIITHNNNKYVVTGIVTDKEVSFDTIIDSIDYSTLIPCKISRIMKLSEYIDKHPKEIPVEKQLAPIWVYRKPKVSLVKILSYLNKKYATNFHFSPDLVVLPKTKKSKTSVGWKEGYHKEYQKYGTFKNNKLGKSYRYDELYKKQVKYDRDNRKEKPPIVNTNNPEKPKKELCILELKSGKIFKGPAKKAHELVETGLYKFCAERFWKRQYYKYNEETGKVDHFSPAKWNNTAKQYVLEYKSNITKSAGGKKLGERSKKRKFKQEMRNHKALLTQGGKKIRFREQIVVKHNKETGLTNITKIIHVPTPLVVSSKEIREEQSQKDKIKYNTKLRKDGKVNKNPVKNKTSRAFHYNISLPGKDVVLTGKIKAMSEKEAKDKLDKLVVQYKAIDYKLISRVDDWVKPVKENRPKNKKHGTVTHSST